MLNLQSTLDSRVYPAHITSSTHIFEFIICCLQLGKVFIVYLFICKYSYTVSARRYSKFSAVNWVNCNGRQQLSLCSSRSEAVDERATTTELQLTYFIETFTHADCSQCQLIATIVIHYTKRKTQKFKLNYVLWFSYL